MENPGQIERRRDWLLLASLGYLALPFALFCLGWLRWEVGVSVVGMLGWVCWRLWARAEQPKRERFGHYGLLFRIAMVYVAAAGVGALMWQTSDYFKHNLIWYDLATKAWPVRYESVETGPVFLCYYVAYYLPVGLIAKYIGVGTVPLVNYLWTVLGLWLALCWLPRIAPSTWGRLLICLLLIGGMGILWGIPIGLREFVARSSWKEGLHIWLEPIFYMGKLGFLFPNTFHQFCWGPQHAVGTLLGSLMWSGAYVERRRERIGILLGLLLFWLPFTALAIGLTTLYWGIQDWKTYPQWLSATNVIGFVPVASISLLYFAAHSKINQHGWILPEFPTIWHVGFLGLYCGCYFGIAWILIGYVQWRYSRQSRLLTMAHFGAIGIACTIWYWMGWFNDWLLRLGSTFMVFIHLGLGQAWGVLAKQKAKNWCVLALLIVLISSIAPLFQIGERLFTHSGTSELVPPITSGYYHSLMDIDVIHGEFLDLPLRHQYLGNEDSFFARHVMKK